MMTRWTTLATAVALLSASTLALTAEKAKPPTQPATGPGGAEYKHGKVVSRGVGVGGERRWIFEPADPAPERAPLVVFNHGWSAIEPSVYGAWIEHLVRRGNIVIYPVYQNGLHTPPDDFTPNAAIAIRQAIAELEEPGHVKPDLTKVAVVGHSIGGVIAANLAAGWEALRIPRPRAVMVIQPGKTWARWDRVAVTLADMSLIDPDTLLLAVTGEHDRVAREIDARRIIATAVRVPTANKSHILLVSDDHGEPPLLASHLAPVAVNSTYGDPPADGTHAGDDGSGSTRRFLPRDRLRERIKGPHRRPVAGEESGTLQGHAAETARVDALDFYGTWKLFDGLTDAVFYATHREYALGNTPQQRFMGRWSDGVPVKELVVDQP